MKPFLLYTAGLLLIGMASLAQPKPKPKAKEKAPTQKEMEDLMKEADQMMSEMSEEDKRMMDSLGIKMPSMKNMPKVTDAQLAEAWEEETQIVPKKNAARIAAIPGPVSAAAMAGYISNTKKKTLPLLKPAAVQAADQALAALQNRANAAQVIGNSAVMLWMMGRVETAVCLMAAACERDPSHTDNLNNYASMLTMLGAAELAIPVLNNLNARFPRNSTLLNNLGQAWFALGDIDKAGKYLDSTLRMAASHPQAAYTKSFIEEYKGNEQAAASLVRKSIGAGYSSEKEDRLRKLGQKLGAADVRLPGEKPGDPLNLGGFTAPPFPTSVSACIAAEPEWKNYRASLDAEIAALKSKYESALEYANKKQGERLQTDIKMVNNAMQNPGSGGQFVSVPMYAGRAALKLNYATEVWAKKMERYTQRATTYLSTEFVQKTKEYDDVMARLREEDGAQTGEGKPNKDFCPKYREASDKYLGTVNPKMEELFKEYLELQKELYNETAYNSMYTQWPEMFEATKLQIQMQWLNDLKANPPIRFVSITEFNCVTPQRGKLGKLQKFDDVACKYHSKFVTPVGTIQADCSNWTTTLDLQAVKFTLKQDMDKQTFGDQFVSCRVEIGPKIGKEAELGPIKVEASIGATLGVEIGRDGVTDVEVGVKAEVGAEAQGIPIPGQTEGTKMGAEAGVESKISLVSGKVSSEGSGILKMLNKN